jgi:hypothetical protein
LDRSPSDVGNRSGISRVKILSIVVILQVLVIAGLAIGLGYLVNAPPQTVTVSGSVTSSKAGYFPDTITFIDSVSTVHYYTYVPDGLTFRSVNGSYSILLPNMHAYYVVTNISNSSGFVGACSAGATNRLQLYTTQHAPFILNIQC